MYRMSHGRNQFVLDLSNPEVVNYLYEQLEHILSELLHADEYGIVLRAKGIVKGQAGEWFHFNYVPGEGSVEVGPADYTGRYCVIGSKLDEEALAELFACEA